MPKFPSSVEEKIKDYQQGLVLQSSDLSLGAISQMVSKGAIDISPTFQRRDRWKPHSQSQLVESFLLNIPVPPVYLSEDKDGTYAVIDGKQRITAIHKFMSGQLKLTGLEILDGLNGLTINDFPNSIANTLDIRPYVRTVTLLRQSNDRVRYEVFLRLNIAGIPLSAMEIRKVAFRGSYCKMIFGQSENNFLKNQLKIKSDQSSAYRKMVDAEYVLRFLTLRETWNEFNGNYRASMDEHMARFHDVREEVVEEHKYAFNRAIRYCEAIWGKHAFQRPEGKTWRNQLLAGVYDAEMIAVDSLGDKVLDNAKKNKSAIIRETRNLFKQHDFLEAATTATNTPARVLLRIERVQDMLVSI